MQRFSDICATRAPFSPFDVIIGTAVDDEVAIEQSGRGNPCTIGSTARNGFGFDDRLAKASESRFHISTDSVLSMIED
jgi:hypothetical protein